MDTRTLADEHPHSAPRPDADASDDRGGSSLAAEVRESLFLLGFAVAVTVGLTAAAQAALALLA
jgi:hypothetical protein